ncbi:MAG: hypothetical protein JSR71_06100 [Proteobacteria bacterium]|nr:hypothetical protein [Pseudomonadota bacterium]MBS1920495.1 hypothetical protein [Bacteroidota bacterium]MBS1931106.1 hypothetical protein [Bacteroidota bacterium]
MLTEDEKKFMEYWEQNRKNRKQYLRKLSIGLPLGVLLVIAIFVNFFSGWDKRADLIMYAQPSLIYVLVGAALMIVAFIVIFSARFRWDSNEQRYQELAAKKNKE